VTAPLEDARLSAIGEDGVHCVLCERLWRGEPLLWHAFVMSATEPVVSCESCGPDDDPEDGSRWHAFEVRNSNGVHVVAGVVCPPCVVSKGLQTAVGVALRRAMRVDQGTN
jgi:hypothetical protein